jgi:hypothetical protein
MHFALNPKQSTWSKNYQRPEMYLSRLIHCKTAHKNMPDASAVAIERVAQMTGGRTGRQVADPESPLLVGVDRVEVRRSAATSRDPRGDEQGSAATSRDPRGDEQGSAATSRDLRGEEERPRRRSVRQCGGRAVQGLTWIHEMLVAYITLFPRVAAVEDARDPAG